MTHGLEHAAPSVRAAQADSTSPTAVAKRLERDPITRSTKRLLLVRHGRVASQYVGRLLGSTDAPLDASYEPQIRMLASRLKQWSPRACFCSPMQRCRQTAAAVAPSLPLRLDHDLREIDFGRWEGRTFCEAAAEDPALVERWAAMSPDFAFPGGESVGDFLHRVGAATERLLCTEAETVLAITHGGVIRMMVCQLLGLDPRHYAAFDVPYATTVVIDVVDGKGVLAALERPERTEGEDG